MKIQALIGIPIALFGVKWLQQQVIDEKPEDIKPLIPITDQNSVKDCPYGYHLENGVCVKSKGIGQ